MEPSSAAAHGAPVLRTISPILPVPDVTAAIRFYRELAKQAMPRDCLTVAEAAALLESLAINHPFVDGNKPIVRCGFTPR